MGRHRPSVRPSLSLMHQLRGRSYFICPSRKVIFSAIPKSGVESLRYLILREEREPNPHRIWEPRFDKYIITIRRSFPADHAYLVIVRNPYHRLVSGYLDKFLTGNFHLLPFCETAMHFYRRSMHDGRRVNFEEFVTFLVAQPPHLVDPHFQPQTSLFRMCSRARIYKLEERGIHDALRELGFTHEFLNYRSHHLYSLRHEHVPNAHQQYYGEFDIAERRMTPVDPPHAAGIGFEGAVVPAYGDFYTEALRKLVYEYYADDFHVLGYAEHSLKPGERP
ncbi:MAG TPA: sulfotransferase family 2 domain-containing protein [Nitrospiria bacterium]|nr:sulfotransferase family 2 domain-containing protein [Nitrospiria bacterium]